MKAESVVTQSNVCNNTHSVGDTKAQKATNSPYVVGEEIVYLTKASVGGFIAAHVGSVKIGCLDVVYDCQRSVPVFNMSRLVSSLCMRAASQVMYNKRMTPCASVECSCQ